MLNTTLSNLLFTHGVSDWLKCLPNLQSQLFVVYCPLQSLWAIVVFHHGLLLLTMSIAFTMHMAMPSASAAYILITLSWLLHLSSAWFFNSQPLLLLTFLNHMPTPPWCFYLNICTFLNSSHFACHIFSLALLYFVFVLVCVLHLVQPTYLKLVSNNPGFFNWLDQHLYQTLDNCWSPKIWFDINVDKTMMCSIEHDALEW